MRAKPIRTRLDLIDLIRPHAPTAACGRAITAGRFSVLGGFTTAEGLPSWIVQVTSRHGREWIIAVVCHETEYRYSIVYLRSVPWIRWTGTMNGKRPLIDGDEPAEYAFKRLIARRYGSA